MIEISDTDISNLEEEILLYFDEARRAVLKNFNDVQACPGSGKTTLIAAKLIILAKKWKEPYKGICILSHTNVAKNEIIQRLSQHPDGAKILSYPHFIGTIQEFINKFLAIPYCRMEGILVNQIDDDLCVKIIENKLSKGAKSYLERKKASFNQLQYRYESNDFILKVPGFQGVSDSSTYKSLVSIKEYLRVKGYHFYREMYEYARAYIEKNPIILDVLRERFPIVFIDEMQDTSLFQDDIINSIYIKGCGSNIQRFGDPDQIIFEGDEKLNDSYNNSELEAITTTHRFNKSIASLASKLSMNNLEIESETNSHYKHTLFLINEKSRLNVIPSFGDLCLSELPTDFTGEVKVVGAVGKVAPESLTICHYFESFDKNNSEKSYRPKKLIHLFNSFTFKDKTHLNQHYTSVLEGLAYYARVNNKSLNFLNEIEKPYNLLNLKKYLKEFRLSEKFNQVYLSLLHMKEIDEITWRLESNKLLEIIGLNNINGSFNGFLDYEGNLNIKESGREINKNKFNHFNADRDRKIEIEISTIHSVKGETHAATLILETKFRVFDIKTILNFILGNPHGILKPTEIKFIRQIYVAMTRPKFLLCLAMDKSGITALQQKKAESIGWNVVDLTVG